MNRFLTIAAVLGVATLLTLAASTAKADQDKKKKKNAAPETPAGTVVGTIQTVSDDGKTITVAGLGGKKKKPAPTTEVKISDKTKVEYAGIDAKDNQKLKIGYAVTVTLDDTAKDTATAIKVSKATEPVAKKKKKKADK
jgi:hypothetical protein